MKNRRAQGPNLHPVTPAHGFRKKNVIDVIPAGYYESRLWKAIYRFLITSRPPPGWVNKELRPHQMVRVFARTIRDVPNRALYADLIPLLTPQKRERVGRLVREEDVVRTLAGERLIRDIIKREIGIEGAAVRIATDAYGKPFIAGYPCLHFNLSHSGLWVVCAVGENPVGIDVELKGDADQQTAAAFFSEEEQRDLSAKPAKDQRSHFHRLWTLKESYMKCAGKGFFTDPASFTVKIEDNRICLKNRSGEIDDRYRFRIFDLDRGYALAACSEGEDFAGEAVEV